MQYICFLSLCGQGDKDKAYSLQLTAYYDYFIICVCCPIVCRSAEFIINVRLRVNLWVSFIQKVRWNISCSFNYFVEHKLYSASAFFIDLFTVFLFAVQLYKRQNNSKFSNFSDCRSCSVFMFVLVFQNKKISKRYTVFHRKARQRLKRIFQYIDFVYSVILLHYGRKLL